MRSSDVGNIVMVIGVLLVVAGCAGMFGRSKVGVHLFAIGLLPFAIGALTASKATLMGGGGAYSHLPLLQGMPEPQRSCRQGVPEVR